MEFPQENLRWRIKNQGDALIRAKGHATSQTDFRLQVVPHFSSGIVKQAKRERA